MVDKALERGNFFYDDVVNSSVDKCRFGRYFKGASKAATVGEWRARLSSNQKIGHSCVDVSLDNTLNPNIACVAMSTAYE